MTFDAQCGIRLKEERERLGLSQQEIADKISIRREMWSRYERGQATPGGDALTAFLKMGGDLIYVLTGESGTGAVSGDERELLASYRKLDVRAKAGVLGMIGGFNSPAPIFHGPVGQNIYGDVTAPNTVNMPVGKNTKE